MPEGHEKEEIVALAEAVKAEAEVAALEAKSEATPDGPEKKAMVAELEEKKAEVEVAQVKGEIAHMEAELEAMPEGPEKEALKTQITETKEEEHKLKEKVELLEEVAKKAAPRVVQFRGSRMSVSKGTTYDATSQFDNTVGKARGMNRKGHDFHTCNVLNCPLCVEEKKLIQTGKLFGLHARPFQASKEQKSRTTNPRLRTAR